MHPSVVVRRSAATKALRSLARGGWLMAVLLLNGGCRASERQGPVALAPPPPLAPSSAAGAVSESSPMQWPVPPPPALQATDPLLWVALAARLGPGSEAAVPGTAPLRLRAAAGMLSLVDGAGQRQTAAALDLQWRWQTLPQPFQLRRRVLGPFASYESADAEARRWAAAGAMPRIARPGDWEVWAPATAPELPGLPSRVLDRLVSGRALPVLGRPEGGLPLRGPIRIEAPGGLLWQGGRYAGPFHLISDAHGTWTLLEAVPLERYLEGVVPHEIGPGAPAEALAAQAVLARTWAVRNRGRYAVDGYHLCADTQCQVYSDPGQASAAVRAAIAATRGEVLAADGVPIQAVYHASNGGVAAGLEEAWEVEAVPYLRPFLDGTPAATARWPLPIASAALPGLLQEVAPFNGADHPLFRWQRQLSASAIATALAARGEGVGAVRGLRVLERGASGRVLAIAIEGSGGSLVLRRDAIRRTLRQLPSTLFTLTPEGAGLWIVRGGGFGHGAGLSQAGAIDLARRGWDRGRILRHYYPGAELRSLEAIGASLTP